MRTSEKTDKIFPALLNAQKEMGELKKNAENTFSKQQYATLGAVLGVVKPVFLQNDISIAQDATWMQDGLTVTTSLFHVSGQWVEAGCFIPMPEKKRDAQAAGSAITYGRRYALKSLAALSEENEDDDGEGATETDPRKDRSPESLQEITTSQIAEINELFFTLGATDNQITKTVLKYSGFRTDAVLAMMKSEGKTLIKVLRDRVAKQVDKQEQE